MPTRRKRLSRTSPRRPAPSRRGASAPMRRRSPTILTRSAPTPRARSHVACPTRRCGRWRVPIFRCREREGQALRSDARGGREMCREPVDERFQRRRKAELVAAGRLGFIERAIGEPVKAVEAFAVLAQGDSRRDRHSQGDVVNQDRRCTQAIAESKQPLDHILERSA